MIETIQRHESEAANLSLRLAQNDLDREDTAARLARLEAEIAADKQRLRELRVIIETAKRGQQAITAAVAAAKKEAATAPAAPAGEGTE